MKRALFAVCVAFALSLTGGCGESSERSPVADQKGSGPATESSDSSSKQANGQKPMAGDSKGIVFGDKFPEVLGVEAEPIDNNSWRFNVKLSSTYDSPQRYADAWRVLDDQDNELGIRTLGHDHANEQPFTRSGTIQIPESTSTVFVEGRDQANGWSGQRFEFKLP